MFNLSELVIWLVIVSILTMITFHAGMFVLEAARDAASYDTSVFFPYYDLM